MSDAFAYRGDAEPEVLTEDVVFEASPGRLFALAYSVTVGTFFLVFFLMMTAEVLATDWSLQPSLLWGAVGVSVLAGAISVIVYRRDRTGLRVTVNREGITVERHGIARQNCRWSEMTIRAKRDTWPCDADGFPLSLSGLESKHADRLLVLSVIRTKVKSLRAQGMAERERIPRKRSWWLLAPLIAVGAGCIPLFMVAKDRFIAVEANPEATLVQRLFGLGELVAAGLGVSLLLLAVQFCEIPLLSWVAKRSRQKHAELVEFINSRHGKLDAVAMEPGRIYRYVCPKGLGESSDLLVAGIVLGILGSLCASLPLFVPHDGDRTPAWILFGCGVGLIMGGIASAIVGLQWSRCLTAKFSAARNGSVELHFGHRIVRCRIAKNPKTTRAALTKFGAVSLVLRGDDGRTYRVDPRYLVED
ncbi:MAG: hypothetical protein P4L46_02045 [Fimbriimonas sp.]|nr:hypothetical protein [Fimbriimonas sp.]